MNFVRAIRCIYLVGALLLFSQSGYAQQTAYAAGQGAVNSIEVGVQVRASVLGRCGFSSGGAPSGRIDQPDFDQSGLSQDFAISLNCTSASRVAVASLNGGMAQQVGDGAAPEKAPYRVSLMLVGDNGASSAASCDASALVSGGSCDFAGAANQSVGLKLASASTKGNGSYLRVIAPRYSGAVDLPAGRYSDTLTITISVSP